MENGATTLIQIAKKTFQGKSKQYYLKCCM